MSIVPSGKRRFMVAQADLPQMSGGSDLLNDLPGDNLSIDNLSNMAQDQEETTFDDEPSLMATIIEFYSSLGYPPRRLQEFKDKFYEEKGSKDGDTNVTMTLPDRLYGKDRAIPKSKIKEFIDEIESKFGLSFIDYKRSNMQLIMNFSSRNPQEDMSDQPGDILDQVYGKPSSGGSKGSSKKASTTKELIKENKDKMIFNLLKILGDKK